MTDFVSVKDLYIVSLNQVRISKETKLFYYYCEFLDDYLVEIHVEDQEQFLENKINYIKFTSQKALLLGSGKP